MSLETRITALATTIAGAINTINAALGKAAATGDLKYAMRSTAPSGWVFACGTIGDATSGAGTRANADCEALFTLLWNEFPSTALFTAGGGAAIRGANAATDWALHRRIMIPDTRGRLLATQDNMAGVAANKITVAGSGVNGAAVGAIGGAETHTLTISEMPSHTHPYSRGVGGAPFQAGSGAGNFFWSYNSQTTSATGGGEDHNNMPPVMIFPLFVKL